MTRDTTQVLHPYPDLALRLRTVGAGRPVLVLHGGHGPANTTGIVDHFEPTSLVMAPTHPGWDGTPRPGWFCGVDDLAVTYLDLLEDRGLRDVLVVATSFGGWIASEMAVRDRGHSISHLVLIDAIGPEIPGHEVQVQAPGDDRPPPKIMEVVYAYTGRSLRDPKLLRRLGRVQIPTLVLWGENDTAVTPDFGRVYADAFAKARFELIADAAHMPVVEAPDATIAAIDAFLADS
jgi:pimeloyl-ACP methyl ester carboxylesterase